jgi:ADP-ribose pyrophosphatase YjhB (NUDIX family)
VAAAARVIFRPADSSWRGFPWMGVRESRNPLASPPGHLKAGESVADGTVREAAEEADVDIDPASLDFTHVVLSRSKIGSGS